MGFVNKLTTGGHYPAADAKKTSVRWLIRLSPLDSHKKSTSVRPATDRNMYSKNIVKPILVGGIPTPLKNMKVSWDDYSIPNIYMESHNPAMFQRSSHHQPEYHSVGFTSWPLPTNCHHGGSSCRLIFMDRRSKLDVVTILFTILCNIVLKSP